MQYKSQKRNSKIWHPFTQHGIYKDLPLIKSAKDEFLYTDSGEAIIDGISSWWVNTHGHSNPKIVEAVKKQTEILQQVIFAGFTHDCAEKLAEGLLEFLPQSLEYLFFSDSGSTAVEVALKMAVGYWFHKGKDLKSKIVALEHSYHGDTFGGMSSGARGVFNAPYRKMLFNVEHLPFPKKGEEQKTIDFYENLLKNSSHEIAAIILEPLILGSGGMLIYEPFVLDELFRLSKKYDVFFILDEVMTGWGRTGTMFAFEQSNIVPDIICLSKGLTGGVLPLAVTVATEEIYKAFYSSDKAKMFYHSSSYTANAIACAAAAANLEIWKSEPVLERVSRINKFHLSMVKNYENNPCVKKPRVLGSIFALDIVCDSEGYLASIADDLYKFFLDRNILLRPLGNTIYVLPPYCISDDSLSKLHCAIDEAVEKFTR